MNEVANIHAQFADSQRKVRELETRVEELTDFIENAALPLHWVNGSGIIIWANKAELEMLGYSHKEYVGKHISTFHADKNACEEILSRLTRKETLQNYPAILRHKNAERISVLINSNVRWEEGKFIHTRCFTRDISDLKRAETDKVDLINELQQKNKALREEIKMLKEAAGSRPTLNEIV